MARGSRKRSSKSRSKSKKTRRRSTKARRTATKQEKLVSAILEQSPYNVFQPKGPKYKMELELFGQYKPMKPMSYYQSSAYPFYPGSNASGLLSGLIDPLKHATTDEPYLSRLLDLNRKTMELVAGKKVGTPSDPLKVIDTRAEAILTGSPAEEPPKPTQGLYPQLGGINGSLPNYFPQQMYSQLFPMGPMRVPLYQDPALRRKIKTLDQMTYTINQDEENKGVISASDYLAVRDKDGIDPDKNYLFVKK